jgi:TPP-dependent pyruvate/acetoin dehydrogenase alpha subunit
MPVKDKSESGAREDSAPADKPTVSLISIEKLLQLYATMIKCRILDERLHLFRWHGEANGNETAGLEASLVGATIDLVRGDAVVPAGWQVLTDLPKGALPERTLKQLVVRAGSQGIRRSSTESRFESAARAARIRKKKRKSNVVVVFADMEAAALPSWGRLLAVAARQELPIVFVVQARRPGTVADGQGENGKEAGRPRDGVKGLPAMVVDGEDAIAVYRVAYEAIARARRGLGPTLVDCEPYRVEVPADGRAAKPERYRVDEAPQGADSIAKMEIYLARKGNLIPGERLRIATAFIAELVGAAPHSPST